MTFIVGLTLLCVAITTLPLFADQVGWTIPEDYSDIFADLIIIGAVLIVACKYIKEAFTKFTAILNSAPSVNAEQPEAKTPIGFGVGKDVKENE